MIIAHEIELALDAFDSIASTSSRTEKEAILREMKDNQPLLDLLYLCYNPFYQFHIKKIPQYHGFTDTLGDMDENFVDFMQLLELLRTRAITGNKAITAMENLFECFTPKEHLWYGRVLAKDLKAGITATTINKVLNMGIPQFNCSLSHPLKESKLPKEFYIDRKLDGYRCLISVEESVEGVVESKMFTRNGKLLLGYDDILEESSRLLLPGYMYDGEIMSDSFAGTQSSAFKKSKGKQGVYYIFDMVPLEEFTREVSTVPYKERLAERNKMFNDDALKDCPIIENVQSYGPFYGKDGLEVVNTYQRQFLDEGYEGSMVKDTGMTYQYKRSWAIQKVKSWDTIDLPIVRVEPGEPGTRLENTLGKVYVAYENNEVGVGSGFSDSERDDLWARRAEIINHTIEVQYFEKSINTKTGLPSLRFPTFIQFRPDKD